MPNEETIEFDLFSQVRRLKPHRKALIIAAAAGAAAGLAYSFIIPPIWRAQTTILLNIDPQSMDKDMIAAAAMSPQAPEPLAIMEGVITSRPSIDAVMKATGEERKTVEEGLTIERTPRISQLSISWDDTDKQKALNAVSTALNKLTELSKNLGFSIAGKESIELRKALDSKSSELKKAEDALVAYQAKMDAPVDPTNIAAASDYLKAKMDLQAQVGAAEEALRVARLQAHQAANEMEVPSTMDTKNDYRQTLDKLQYQLEIQKTQYGDTAPQVETIRRQLDVTEQALKRSVREYLQSVDQNLDANVATMQANLAVLKWRLAAAERVANKAPVETVEVARLMREVRTLGGVVDTLRGKYEEAKVKAEVEDVKWTLLEAPFIQDEPTNKHRIRYMIAWAFFFVFLTGIYKAVRNGRGSNKAAA